jgi:hypothetical protein
MTERPELWDRGLVNRFWFCVAPDPTEDDLQDEEVAVSDALLHPYRDRLRSLGLYFRNSHPVDPYTLSEEADRAFTAWRNQFKRRHRLAGSELHHITGFCRKLEDKVLRWATNLHVFSKPKDHRVAAQPMQDAITLSRFALSHFQHIYGLTHGSQASALERALRRHLCRKKGREITLRDIRRGLPSFAKASVEMQDEALDNLAEDGFLQRKEVKRAEGGRPSLRVIVL